MYLALTCAGDAHRQEAYPSRPKTLIHLNPQLAPSATLLPDKGANDTDQTRTKKIEDEIARQSKRQHTGDNNGATGAS